MRGLSLQIWCRCLGYARLQTHWRVNLAVGNALRMHIEGGHHALALHIDFATFLQSEIETLEIHVDRLLASLLTKHV